MRIRNAFISGFTVVSLCIVGPVLISAQTGKQSLFPVGEGSSWEFAGTAGGQAITMSAAITASKAGKDGRLVTVHWLTGGNPVQDEVYLVTAASVSRTKSGKDASNSIAPPIPVIQYPMQVGRSWKWNGKISIAAPSVTLDANSTLKVAKKEQVKTGAGTFDAYRVDMVLNIVQGTQTMTVPNSYWFAPGIGLVRQLSEITAPGGKKIVVDASISKYSIK